MSWSNSRNWHVGRLFLGVSHGWIEGESREEKVENFLLRRKKERKKKLDKWHAMLLNV